jgi:hypothetical protein
MIPACNVTDALVQDIVVNERLLLVILKAFTTALTHRTLVKMLDVFTLSHPLRAVPFSPKNKPLWGDRHLQN